MKTCESGQTKESGGKGDRSKRKKKEKRVTHLLSRFVLFYEINHPNRSTQPTI